MDIDPNNSARAIVNAAISKIPYAGGIASSILGILWPKNKRDVWPSIEERARTLIASMIDENNLKALKSELDGLKNLVTDLQNYEKHTALARTQLQTVLNFFNDRAPLFCDKTNVVGTMPYFVQMASMHLSFLKARCDDPASLSSKPVPANELTAWKDDLKEKINYYIGVAEKGFAAVYKKRCDSIGFELTSLGGGIKVHDRFLSDEKIYEYYHLPGKYFIFNFCFCATARKIVISNRFYWDFLNQYMVPAWGWRQLDPYAPTKSWNAGSPRQSYWLVGLQNQQVDPELYVPFPMDQGLIDVLNRHDFGRYDRSNPTVSESGRLEYLSVCYGDAIDFIDMKFAGKHSVEQGSQRRRRDGGWDQPQQKDCYLLSVPDKQWVTGVEARVADKLIAMRLLFDDESTSVWANGDALKGESQVASFTDYVVSELAIADCCSAIRVGLTPKLDMERAYPGSWTPHK